MTPAPKQPGYGYLPSAQSSPDYPQYPQPATPFTPQPFDINALFKILGVAPGSSTTGSTGMGGIGGPIGVTPPMPPRGGPVQSLPPMPPQMPIAGMPVAPPMAPPMAPQMPESRPEEVFPGQQPQGQGLDVQKLLAMLRAMQGRRVQQPQPPRGGEGAPRMGPSPTMRGSGMGLEGILQGIEASKQSSR
jgi:hypothetical protein